MGALRTYLLANGKAAATAAASVLLCAGFAFAVAAGMGSGAFDPSGFLGAGLGAQSQPDYDTAYDVNRSEAEGDANMQADKHDADDKPSGLDQVDGATTSPDGAGSSGLSIVDGPAGATVAGGTGSGDGASGGSTVGPVVDGGDGGSGGGDGADGGDTPGPTPDPVDPDPGPSELPDGFYEDFSGDDVPLFPDGGMPAPGPDQPQPEVKLLMTTASDITDAYGGMSRLYYGQMLTDWKILCATSCYLMVDGTRYRLGAFDENFQVGPYPANVGDAEVLTIEFRARLNAQSPWIVEKAEFEIAPYKVYVQGWEQGQYVSTHYPTEQDQVFLSPSRDSMLPEDLREAAVFEGVDVSEFFAGWTDGRDGRCYSLEYAPPEKGLTVLRPLPMQPVLPGYRVQYTMDFWSQAGKQTLLDWPDDTRVLSVPAGIEAVERYSDDPVVFDVVEFPESLQEWSVWTSFGVEVRQAYRVDERNRTFFSQDGMLFSRYDNAIVDIPSTLQDVSVPAETVSIAVPSANSISRLRLHAGVPDYLALENLHGAAIVVPDEYYVDYLRTWGSNLHGNTLEVASGGTPDYYLHGETLLSRDATGTVTLEQVLPSAAGTCIVSEDVEKVKAGAVQGCENLETLVLPAGLRELEAGSLAGPSSLKRVLLQGAQPPSIASDTFGQVKAQVVPALYAGYRSAWEGVLGSAGVDAVLQSHDFQLRDVEGYTVLQEGGSTLLVEAPLAARTFTGETLGSLSVDAIDAQAFKGCTQLWRVDLPASVASIGREAFSGCTALEAFYQRAPDAVFVGAEAFSGCAALRFAVFEAQAAKFADGDMLPYYLPGLAREGSTGYPWLSFDLDNAEFSLVEQGEGLILYSERTEDAAVAGTCLMRATTNVSGAVVAREGTASLGPQAFSYCQDVTAFDFAQARSLVALGDSAFFAAGLRGSIVVPDNVSIWGNGVFASCKSLERVHVEGSRTTSLGASAFDGCSLLSEVTFGPSCALSSIAESTFADTRIVSIDLPAEVRELDFSAFWNCAYLESVTLPASVRSLGSDVFGGCTSLRELVLSSEAPPLLLMYSWAVPFSFGDGLPSDFGIVLSGDASADAYVQAWKFPLLGKDAGYDELTPEEDLAGTNAVRVLLGLPVLDELPASLSAAPPAAEEPVASGAGEAVPAAEEREGEPAVDEPAAAAEGPSAAEGAASAASSGATALPFEERSCRQI